MGNKEIKWYYSWVVIAIAIFCFWPVGVLLILGRSKADRKLSFKITKLLNIVAIAWLVIVVLVMFSEPMDSDTILGLVILAIPSILVLLHSRKQKKKTQATKKYIDIIVNGGERQLDNIASAVGVTYDTACKQVQELIDGGYFKNMYINKNERIVVVNNPKPEVQSQTTVENVAEQTVSVQSQPARIVKCATCGANNTIYGESGECEYCGSPLK